MTYNLMSLLWIVGTVPFLIFSVQRLAYELHMMQLNTYRNDRYGTWLRSKGSKRYKDLLGLLAAVPLIFIGGFVSELVSLLLWALFYVIFLQSRDKTPPKKPLVFTKRATRLYVTLLVFYFLLAVAVLFLIVANEGTADMIRGIFLLFLALLPFFSPLFIVGANTFMQPFEEHQQSKLFDEAHDLMEEQQELLKIAITGSYGKTSVKHILNRMLEEKYYTLMPPGSYNTPMGITKVIREELKPIHQAFVTEMGAKQEGDITELCTLVKPKYGIITALGEAHLESFGSFENIIKTKFELVEALPEDGVAVLNFDDEAIRNNAHRVKGKVVTYGIESTDVDFWATDIRYYNRGTEFTLRTRDGVAEEFKSQLLGIHNVYNIVGAAAMAYELGVSFKQMKRAVSALPPVEHRLALKTTSNGLHIIDDAFNANPVGAGAAMDVLGEIEGGKKFLITPGMVELGEKEYEENKIFGEKAATACDYIALVGEKQTEPMKVGILNAGFPEDHLFIAQNLNDANNFVYGKACKGDYVLYENDLPDTYNE
jgi:UDP-N-acetylmuramoyl-tripeptide--D-alanyl-D-alanine ligase